MVYINERLYKLLMSIEYVGKRTWVRKEQALFN